MANWPRITSEMLPNYQKSYSILGVFQDDDWETVRNAYKRQIRRWHPDRFQDPEQRRVAESKSMEINHAYQSLDEYYRQHGGLPQAELPDQDGLSGRRDIFTGHESHAPEGTGEIPDKAPAWDKTGSSPRSTRHGLSRTLFVIAALAVGYWLTDPLVTDPASKSLTASSHGTVEVTSPAHGVNSGPPDPASSYSSGELGGLRSAPSSWNDEKSHTLPKSGHPAAQEKRLPYITRGSTKADVLALQGPPTRMTDTAWEYGLSTVSFQNGRVIDWYENPMNPLLIRK